MQTMPDECIDLTVTSPPYDNLRTYKGYKFEFNRVAWELLRITKPGGVVVWVVGDATIKGSETGTSFKQALYFKEIGFNLHDTMIFHKPNAMPLTHNRYDPAFEYMFILSKGKPKVFNPIKEECKYAGGVKKRHQEKKATLDVMSSTRFRDEENTYKELKYRKNLWSYPVGVEPEVEIGNHPAPFPQKLAGDHVVSWSNEGDLVLDPMCGSGTTLKMAKQLGRNYIGIDISNEYCEIARRRVNSLDGMSRIGEI